MPCVRLTRHHGVENETQLPPGRERRGELPSKGNGGQSSRKKGQEMITWNHRWDLPRHNIRPVQSKLQGHSRLPGNGGNPPNKLLPFRFPFKQPQKGTHVSDQAPISCI